MKWKHENKALAAFSQSETWDDKEAIDFFLEAISWDIFVGFQGEIPATMRLAVLAILFIITYTYIHCSLDKLAKALSQSYELYITKQMKFFRKF